MHESNPDVKKVVFRIRIQEGKNPPKRNFLRIWMFSLEGRRSPRAWKSVMKACEETRSAILDF
jgi:hypothetical protein